MLDQELKDILQGDVYSDDASRKKFSTDYSIFKVVPEVIVAPKDEHDVMRLVQFVTAKRKAGNTDISLTGRSAGTDMTGGPLNDSIIVSFTQHINAIKELNDGADGSVPFVRVEPELYFRDLEPTLDEHHVLYPPFPASKGLCALGGIMSNNSAGEKTLSYGKTADYVQALRVVMADASVHEITPLSGDALQAQLAEEGFEGDCYRKLYALLEENYDRIQAARPHVSKNSAGYALWDVWNRETGVFDLTRLFVGSQGTLGLITEGTLRLVPIQPYHGLGVIFLRDLSVLPSVIEEVMSMRPETFESYDDRTLEVALRFLPDMIKNMKGGIFKLAWQFLPEAIMALRGGLPKLVLLVEFTAKTEDAMKAALFAFKTRISKLPVQIRVIDKASEEEKYWAVRRQSFALLHNHNKNKSTVPFIDDIIVAPEHLPEFLPRVNAILDRYKKKMIYTIAGHVGDGNFHIIPLMDMRDPEARALIPVVSKEIYELVKSYKGSITAEHNDGLIRTVYLEEMYGPEVVKIFEQVKDIFDPLRIFNPRKKVGGDMDWVASHITKENF